MNELEKKDARIEQPVQKYLSNDPDQMQLASFKLGKH